MSFTDQIKMLKPGQYPDESLLAEIGNALRRKLRSSGLWEFPPSYLGYGEFHSWTEAFSDGAAHAVPTLDCYLEAIVARYGSLMHQLTGRKTNIDGLVHLNIKRFILKRQKEQDPVGYAVFKNLEAVLLEMVGENQIRPVGTDAGMRLRNQTILEFVPSLGDPPAQVEQLRAAVADVEWQKTLARLSKLGKGAQRFLREHLARLSASGVRAFRIGDLADVLKTGARAAHVERNRPPTEVVVAETSGDQEVLQLIWTIGPSTGYELEEHENFSRLIQCIQARIASADVQDRTRDGLLRVFEELRAYAQSDESTPSWAEMSRRLGARRTTLWDHLRRIREFARECQQIG